MNLRLSPQAEADLDSVWYYIATESANVEIADRFLDSLTSRFLLIARHPYIGRSREYEFGPGMRSLAVAEYVTLLARHRRSRLSVPKCSPESHRQLHLASRMADPSTPLRCLRMTALLVSLTCVAAHR